MDRRWKEKGVDESPVDLQAVNDALKPLCHAIEPRRAIALCLASAKAVDAELEIIRPDLVERIEATATQFRFNRALHRNDHLRDIEALLPSRGILAAPDEDPRGTRSADPRYTP